MSLSHSVSWTNGQWLPMSEIKLAVDDLGCLQGVMVVDRLRTAGGYPLDTEQHLDRWRAGCAELGIELSELHSISAQIIHELVTRNQGYASTDVGIVILATPGRVEEGATPTLLAHISPIPWSALHSFYVAGQPLQVSAQQVVPAACWSLQVKNRARINYYLADRAARMLYKDRLAAGVLVTPNPQGQLCLADTSSANLLVVERMMGGGLRLVSPEPTQCLNGISLQRTLRLAESLGITVAREPVAVQRGLEAIGLLLAGSTGCLWWARSLNERRFQLSGEVHDLYQQLTSAWSSELGLNFVTQAAEMAATAS